MRSAESARAVMPALGRRRCATKLAITPERVPFGALSLTGLGPGPRRPGCCPKTSRPTTNSTLICELSCRARYAGKIAPCVSCTDNGRFMDGAFCAFAGLYSLNYPRFVSQTYQLCKTETLICETSL